MLQTASGKALPEIDNNERRLRRFLKCVHIANSKHSSVKERKRAMKKGIFLERQMRKRGII
ncbi:hypothetical protein PT277_01695 [Acetobacteraceae bacterium ESL0709]|nr:hypothetical protein [Acetobacteraceae bacterium ESL0709]